ncbi:GMF family protein [Rutstroemia sp. NJR-2017a BBW]|nr:GMF family protein [Rutstroemia sp. NJR-2017a BBW]
MASESRLYTFSPETRTKLRKFRLDLIDKATLEIKQDEEETVYKDLQSIGDDLPDHSPRFVLLSYPLTLSSGRLSVPYVLLFYLPPTVNAEQRMLYAGAKELMRNTAEVGKVIEIESAEDLEEIPEKLNGGE